ncbi:hypothetical protein [Pseudomonas sp. C2B4]|uniref:hypothetical protein n=1 Tax=Pseudomonas sp. C2B4 TaxID=2735270 RepID=UPI00158616E3|nr:hypothetical protein [Pseudomonas sp. C2B4]NUU38628.1 hypothetical protein [Pseudomonas sp. C2B4]
MSTDRQKSFIATLGTDNSPLHFLDVLHDKRILVAPTFISGGFFTGRPQHQDHSHFLGLRPGARTDSNSYLVLYFRHTQFGYILYNRTPGPHYGKCLGSSDEGLIGAFSPKRSTTFHLLNNNGETVNLDNFNNDAACIYLKARHSGLIHMQTVRGSPYHYVADNGGVPLVFSLKILERNAPYIDYPDEI